MTTSASTAESGFADLVEQFQNISSMYFKASVEMRVYADSAPATIANDGRAINGTVQYWASEAGNKYRLDSVMDTERYEGMDTTLAYDGEYYQVFLRPGLLSYSAVESDLRDMTLPNPMLELLRFIYPITDENEASRLRLKDIVDDEEATNTAGDAQWEYVEEETSEIMRAGFSGGTHKGTNYDYRVYADANSKRKPMRVEQIADDGQLLSRTQFSHYQKIVYEGSITYWPQVVRISVYDEQGNTQVVTSFNVKEFSLNGDFDDSVFTIDWSEAERVWDADAETYVQ